MRSGVEYFFATPSTKAEILTLNKNVLRKNIYVQTKAILKNQWLKQELFLSAYLNFLNTVATLQGTIQILRDPPEIW